ncbi:hypothetical protein J3R30DRAFT_3400703 [Lentinula aciculospora]|uniref:Uncharacterized protein n=1 Tax=Lentinula aciculospora TaxID=153920 RepID=A0A9W9AS84_9AGAR|nr:hypothetical protein J3R30DRAFT_3400703 [Lentinula aciculospora]
MAISEYRTFAVVVPKVTQPPYKRDALPAIPTFTRLYDATILLVPNANAHITESPFGEREYIGFIGGNCTDPTTGEVIANVVPNVGGEFGIISSENNALYTDVHLVLQFVDDGDIAYLSGEGVGTFGATTAAVTYLRMETSSASRQNLVTTPLLLSIEFPSDLQRANETVALFSLFVLASTTFFFFPRPPVVDPSYRTMLERTFFYQLHYY